MNNEKIQIISEKAHILKKGQWQGDIVSPILFYLTKNKIKEPILDIGAGTGALIKELMLRDYQNSLGIDLYPKSDFIKKGIITNIPEKDKSFSTVFCIEVIEHLTDNQIKKGLDEIKRVLKTNGTFILTVPYNENLELNSFVCPNCKHKFHKVGHLQSFDKRRIRKILEEAGFKILSIKIYALGAMSKLPLGRYFNRLFLKLNYESISKTMLIVCRKRT